MKIDDLIDPITLEVPADGLWHDVVTDLTNFNAYQIIAKASSAQLSIGKHALLHAYALNSFGKGKVNITQAYYGAYWNKLSLKWIGNKSNYKLQIRSKTNYGDESKIICHISNLLIDKVDLT